MQDDRFDDYDDETQKAVLSYESMHKGHGNVTLDPTQIADVIDFYLDEDEIDDARSALDYGRNIYPHDELLAQKEIHVMLAEGEDEQVITILETQIRQNPDDVELYVSLAASYARCDRLDDAIETYKEYLKKKPKDVDAYVFLVMTLLRQDKLEEALQYCKKAFQIAGNEINEKDSSFLLFDTTSQVFSELQKDKEAVSFFENIVSQNPLIADGWETLAFHKMELYTLEGDLEMAEEAIEAVEHCVAIMPEDEKYYIRLAEYHANLEHFDAADNILQEASQRFPDSNAISFQRGQIYHLQQNFSDAIKYYREAKNKGFDDGILWSNLAHCHVQLGHTKIALQAILMAVEKSPEDETVLLSCASTAEMLHLRELSKMIYDKVLQTAPEEPGIYNFKASTLINEGKYDEAVDTLEKSLEKGFFDSITYILLCTALYHLKEFDRLFFYLEEGMNETPFFLRLLQEYSPEIFENPSVLLFLKSGGKDETMK